MADNYKLPFADTDKPITLASAEVGGVHTPIVSVLGGVGDISATPVGTAGTPNASVVTVQGVTGGTPQPTTDAGFTQATSRGVAGVPFTSADATAAADVTDAPTSGQKLVITDLVVSVDTAMSVTFKCATSGAVICGPFYLGANSTINPLMRGGKRKLATADKKLQVVASVAGNISVEAAYYSEA